ncbi:MAG: UDP-3-O-(3-hydroxymyristoyl)glucosamine N-acyltransferase [Cyanobacteriota bacterium]|nr:UDP-3-O-(3-hydroxymyristoyl)glucosamine N-acyltransferase [Cyanobacteriota bacterium]
MQLQTIAQRLHLALEGDPTLEITGVAALGEAQPGQLSFVSDPKYLPLLEQTQASALVLDEKTVAPPPIACLRARDPRLAFAQAIELFYQPYQPPLGIHPTAVIAPDVQLGEQVSIGSHVVLGAGVVIGSHTHIHANVTIYPQVQIGEGCQLFANCVIHERTIIGHRCLIHSGAVIGDDGFGHVPQADGRWYRMMQSGHVVLEDDVDVGSNTTIDRPAVGETRIGRGTKIDNLVQIGHGVKMGSHCVIVSQVGIAGGTQLGNHVILAGQVGIVGHITIGDRVIATGQTGITSSVAAGETVSGYPHQSAAQWRRLVAIERNLPDLLKKVRQLEQQVEKLNAAILADNS